MQIRLRYDGNGQYCPWTDWPYTIEGELLLRELRGDRLRCSWQERKKHTGLGTEDNLAHLCGVEDGHRSPGFDRDLGRAKDGEALEIITNMHRDRCATACWLSTADRLSAG